MSGKNSAGKLHHPHSPPGIAWRASRSGAPMVFGVASSTRWRAANCFSRDTKPSLRCRHASASPAQARVLRHGLQPQLFQNLNSVQ